MRTLGLVCSAAGSVGAIRPSLIEPAVSRGWRVAVTVTPTAGNWLRAQGELDRIETVTGLPVRDSPRLPTGISPHPPVDRYLVCPATANTVAKLALGIADNQALTTVCEAIGDPAVPVAVFPTINASHARHPAWHSHVAALRSAGVHLLMGDDFWPLREARNDPGQRVPWQKVLDTATHIS